MSKRFRRHVLAISVYWIAVIALFSIQNSVIIAIAVAIAFVTSVVTYVDWKSHG